MSSSIYKWNGASWINTPIFKWNGASWINANSYKWDGSSWLNISEEITTITKEYKALYSRSYLGGGSPRPDASTRPWLHQGYFSSANGTQSSILIFDYITMQKELVGKEIVKVEMYMKNEHSYEDNGLTLRYQNTALKSIPSTFKPSVSGSYFEHFDKGEGKWIVLDNAWGNWFKSGAVTGISIFTQEKVTTNYGYFTAHNTANPPKLRITYKK